MRYFLGIVGILRFCDVVIFPSRRNTLIFQSCSMCFQCVYLIISVIFIFL